MSEKTDAKTVVVSGDFTLDWNLAHSRGLEAQRGVWEPEVCPKLRWQRDGAALLADLIDGIADQIRDRAAYEIRQPNTRGVPGLLRMIRSAPRTRASVTPMAITTPSTPAETARSACMSLRPSATGRRSALDGCWRGI